MKRRKFFVLLLGNLAWLLLPGCGADSPSGPKDETPEPTPSPEETRALAAYKKENRLRLETAEQRAQQQQRLGEAAAKTPEYRTRLQWEHQGAWTAFLDEHRAIFLSLRQQAAKSSTHYLQCTICEGTGQLKICVICNNTGVCPTCKGKGILYDDSICPACQGDGKCFLCAGTGKMIDPFCDDGLVYANQPFPPYHIPIST